MAKVKIRVKEEKQTAINATPAIEVQKPKKPFYHRFWFYLLTALFCWPVFLIFNWKDPDEKLRTKILNTVMIGVLFIIEATAIGLNVYSSVRESIESKGNRQAVMSESSEDTTYEKFVQMVSSELDKAYRGKYSITKDGEIINIAIYESGLTEMAEGAKKQDSINEYMWLALGNETSTLSTALTNLSMSLQMYDYLVHLSMCDETDHNTVLLKYANGTCLYDAVYQK